MEVMTTCCNFTNEDIATVQDALTGSIVLTPLTVYPEVANTSTCVHNQSATIEGYLSDSILLISQSAHVYLKSKAQITGQDTSELTLTRHDFEIYRFYLLKEAVEGCTGMVLFNSKCNRVTNIAAVRNFVPVHSGNIPWSIEKRAYVITSPDEYSLKFKYPNGTPSTTSILVFYDGTQDIPPDRIYRFYYRGNLRYLVVKFSGQHVDLHPFCISKVYLLNSSTDFRVVSIVEGTFLINFLIAVVIYIVIIHFQDKYALLKSDGWVYKDEDVNRVAGES